MQSPKSKRPEEPGKRSIDDGLSVSEKGGTRPERHASGPESPRVPSGLQHSGGRHQGNVDAESAVPTHSPAPHQGGGPKTVDRSTGDQMRKGGSIHQT